MDRDVPAGPTPRRVLVVEDHRASALLVRTMLARRPEYHVEVTGSLAEALAVALGPDLARRPDVVLCDVQLPDGLGLELVRRLGDGPATAAVPVVFLTADASRARADEIAALGARQLVKPFDVDELFAVLDATLDATLDAALDPASGRSAGRAPRGATGEPAS